MGAISKSEVNPPTSVFNITCKQKVTLFFKKIKAIFLKKKKREKNGAKDNTPLIPLNPIPKGLTSWLIVELEE